MERTMDNAATVRRLYDLINTDKIDAFGEVLADDFIEHEELPGLEPTRDGVQAFFRMQRAAFTDMRMDIEDLIIDGDKVAARVRYTGTQDGEFMGAPATGKRVDVQLVDIFRFGADGRLREHWGVLDQLTLLQQLGMIPEGAPA
jgi:steroid delta-isomerase-like uncharacterized protein